MHAFESLEFSEIEEIIRKEKLSALEGTWDTSTVKQQMKITEKLACLNLGHREAS